MIKFDRSFSLSNTQKAQTTITTTLKKLQEEMQSHKIGYYNLPQNSLSIIKEIENLDLEKYSQIVIMGVGGSSLGIKAIDTLLRPYSKNTKEILYFENSDPIGINTTLNKIKKEEALFFVISKSGLTIETISIFKTLIKHCKLDFNSDDTKQIFVITDKNSALSTFAKHHKITEFNIPSNVGGRFSVLSAVGIAPLMMAGYNISLVLKGANNFLTNFFDGREKHLLEKAFYLSTNSHKIPINILFSYADGLKDFTKWFIQLWAESLGKSDENGNHMGLTPVGLTGATDQHSFLQLIVDGHRNKSVTFIKIKDFADKLSVPSISLYGIEKTDFMNNKKFATLINAQCDATMQSLIDKNISTDIITIDSVNEEDIGALIIYFEILTSAVGSMMGINTYNQPGVEFGKKIMHEKLSTSFS